MRWLIFLSLVFQIVRAPAFSQNNELENDIDKESELIDFKSIRGVLKNDMLGSEVQRKKKKIQKIKRAKHKAIVQKYNVPGVDEFWTFFSEYWMVKNAPILKWDFQKPDYGLEVAFRAFLEKMGVYEKNFKILLVNTPDVTHYALPSNPDELIFVLSVPFVRTLDLSKLEIAILLFEDYLRHKAGFFEKFVSVKGLGEFIGSNFHGKGINHKLIKEVSKRYDELVFDKGFNFQQQFVITKEMSNRFKSDLKLWNAYFAMLKKIDDLVKSNILYQKYIKIYPSPELQLNWLRPKKEIL